GRYADVSELAAALQVFLAPVEPEPVVAAPAPVIAAPVPAPAPVGPTTAPPRRGPLVAILIVIVAIGIIVAVLLTR
ncbi:MAG: hypothetical protein NT062_26685, partial [Proteobacteria bacterium]|nr:hypothetical protein [Pseudomonadota bacterium]